MEMKWSIPLASKRPTGANYQQKGQQYAWKITLWGCKKMRMLSNESILEQHRYNILGIYLCETWCHETVSAQGLSSLPKTIWFTGGCSDAKKWPQLVAAALKEKTKQG